MLSTVRNSDGHLTPFDGQKIVRSLLKDIPDVTLGEASEIAYNVENIASKLCINDLSGSVIRGLVENEMLRLGREDWQRLYKRVGIPLADVKRIWQAVDENNHENANLDSLNPESMHKHIADLVSKQAALTMLPKDLADLHISGAFHIHDLEYFMSRPFCFDSDLRYIFYYGLMPDGRGVNLPVARAAQCPEVAILHAAKALGCNQTCFAGGQGFQNFLTFLAPYFEGLDYERIKQLIQMFIFEMSQMMVARGGQVIFSSVQLTPGVPLIWRDKPAVYAGHVWDGKDKPKRYYGEFEREVRLAFKAFCGVMMEGDMWGKPFNFPKFEMVLMREFWNPRTRDIPLNTSGPVAPSYYELYRDAFRLSVKYGTPYIDNQLPKNRNAESGISCFQCCAYCWNVNGQTDPYFEDKLYFRNGAHFSLGSMQVVTLNLPRAAYIANGDYYEMLDYLYRLIDSAIEVFKVKKEVIAKQPLPFTRQTPTDPNNPELKAPPYADIDGLSYVIGVVGLNELCQHFTGQQMHESEESWKLGLQVMEDLKKYIEEAAKNTGLILSLARTPAETTAQRFAVSDLLNAQYKEKAAKVVKGYLVEALSKIDITHDLPVEYSNGTHLCVDAPIRIRDKIAKEEAFFKLVDGGNIFHLFLDDMFPPIHAMDLKDQAIPDSMIEEVMEYIFNVADTSNLSYIKISKDLTICKICHATRPGLNDYCLVCSSPHVDHIALVTGYLAPLSSMNEAKKAEIRARRRYNVTDMRNGMEKVKA